MEAEFKPRALRIISGTAEVVEAEINRLLKDYAVMSYNFAVVGSDLIITALLVHGSEVRKAQLMQTAPVGRG